MHPFALHNKLRHINKRSKTQLYKNNKLAGYMFRPSRGYLQDDIKKHAMKYADYTVYFMVCFRYHPEDDP